MLETVKNLCDILAAVPPETPVKVSTNGYPLDVDWLEGEVIIRPKDRGEYLGAHELMHILLGNYGYNNPIKVSTSRTMGVTSVLFDGKSLYINSGAMGAFMKTVPKPEVTDSQE